ncbi:MAG: metal-sensing transcriptional repressor, partial [Deltaproteobacteria bacterium]|nr:metal-sensing transcriptional repressor [Deltaproteobacteria bacterium]
MQENLKSCCQKTPQRLSLQPILKLSHPDHTSELARLKKIQGQVDGLVKMISEQRYCV